MPWNPLRRNVDLQTTRGNNGTEVLERAVSPEGYECKGYYTIEQCHLLLLCQSLMLSVYGLGHTTISYGGGGGRDKISILISTSGDNTAVQKSK